MFKVIIENTTSYRFVYQKLFNAIFEEVAKICGLVSESEVNVIIGNDKMMQDLNKKYRNLNQPTDILSFTSDYKRLFPILKYNLLGDIYFSFEKIINQAKTFNHSIKREWCYLFAHGLLHLLGFDHKTTKTTNKMNQITENIMETINIRREK